MKNFVIDASVAIKWFIPEIHEAAAMRFLDLDSDWLVPDLVFAEVGNILWKKYRSQQLTLPVAEKILHDFKRLPFETYPTESLLNSAWQIATKYQRTIYDSLYLALAQKEKCVLVTADQAFYNAMHTTPLARYLMWVEDTIQE